MSLAVFVNEHREAINHDLIKCGHTLDEVGGVLSWDALGDFISKSEPDSALARDINDEEYKWALTIKTNEILADIYDLIAAFRYDVTAILSKKKPKKPKPYIRPRKKKETKRIGKGGLPKAELRKWIETKLKGSEPHG